jgi:hypothetical protein
LKLPVYKKILFSKTIKKFQAELEFKFMRIMKIKLLCFVCIFFCNVSISQTLSGKVLDALTKEPIEAAAIYFNNTTIGTVSNVKGDFSISYSNAIKSDLIISYLGYQTETISNYRELNEPNIYLKPINNILDEVVINVFDGLTREQKLKVFRDQFLGETHFGKSCTILNEDDLILKYDKKAKKLTASNLQPLVIKNQALQYLVTYDIVNFETVFSYVEPENNLFNTYSVIYSGKTFFKDFESLNSRKALRNRKIAYEGSTMQFLRALYNQDFETDNFKIFYKNFQTNPWEYFKIGSVPNTELKRVFLHKKLNILHKQKQSAILFTQPSIFLDKYGNYVDIKAIYFSGFMSTKRIGDTLPLNYGLND